MEQQHALFSLRVPRVRVTKENTSSSNTPPPRREMWRNSTSHVAVERRWSFPPLSGFRPNRSSGGRRV